jgi:ferredoxin
MRVWVDQDLCTGDGLCTDHCPEVFILLEDGLCYVRDSAGSPGNDPGGSESIVSVRDRLTGHAIAAAVDCPGECIFLEDEARDDSDDSGVSDADVVDLNTEP